MTAAQHQDEGYVGPAELLVTPDGDGDPVVVRSGAAVVLQTPEGTAHGRLSDRDPWGRYRISGTGRPPFEVTADS